MFRNKKMTPNSKSITYSNLCIKILISLGTMKERAYESKYRYRNNLGRW